MPHVQRIAASRVVHVVARLPFDAPVVRGVVDTPEANRGAQMVSLRGVVVNYIEDDFETSRMQRPHHVLEFCNLIACRARR